MPSFVLQHFERASESEVSHHVEAKPVKPFRRIDGLTRASEAGNRSIQSTGVGPYSIFVLHQSYAFNLVQSMTGFMFIYTFFGKTVIPDSPA